MFVFHKNIKIIQRRAVSQIIGSLFMLAIVAAFGSILMFQGLEGINEFTGKLNIFDESKSKSIQENIVIEHVRFQPDGDDMQIWIRNIGTTDIIIDRITMVKIDTQELVILNDTQTVSETVTVFPEELQLFYITGSSVTLPSGCTQFQDSACVDSAYQLSLTTTRGNTFKISAQPFNT